MIRCQRSCGIQRNTSTNLPRERKIHLLLNVFRGPLLHSFKRERCDRLDCLLRHWQVLDSPLLHSFTRVDCLSKGATDAIFSMTGGTGIPTSCAAIHSFLVALLRCERYTCHDFLQDRAGMGSSRRLEPRWNHTRFKQLVVSPLSLVASRCLRRHRLRSE